MKAGSDQHRLPETLHADNGPDFRSRAFERACRNHGVQVDWRPPGTPHFGGHIERLMMGAVHLLVSVMARPQCFAGQACGILAR